MYGAISNFIYTKFQRLQMANSQRMPDCQLFEQLESKLLLSGNVNHPPEIANQVPDQTAIVGIPFEYELPTDVFFDVDGDELLKGVNSFTFGPSQFSSEMLITTSVDYARYVHAADIDKDGYIDAISSSSADNKIAWYRNNGNGTFGQQQVISDTAEGAADIYAVDINNDGNIDVLSALLGHKIVWYKNLGNGIFDTEQVVSPYIGNAISVIAKDLDNDGDVDIINAELNSFTDIAWYENLGNGTFGPQQDIPSIGSIFSIYASDLDNDGLVDVISASLNDQISWYKNLGDGSFSAQVITTFVDKATSVYASDLNNDGLNDVISASQNDNKIAWYKNLGNGDFSEQIIISLLVDSPWSVNAADIDNDGDIDVLSASEYDDKIAWYENLGEGIFGNQQIISSTLEDAHYAYPADFDNDGDLDVLSASGGSSGDDDKIVWFKNNRSINLESLPEWLAFNNQQTLLYGTPVVDDIGTQQLSFWAEDSSGEFVSTEFELNIIPNTPPQVTSIEDQKFDEDAPIDIILPVDLFSDPDQNDVLSYTATLLNGTPLPDFIDFDSNQLQFIGMGTAEHIGQHIILITATDLAGNEAQLQMTLEIDQINFLREDLNTDGQVNTQDIDELNVAILLWNTGQGGDLEIFDLTDDDQITSLDRDYLVQTYFNTEFGDANLDQIINVSDLSQLAANFGNESVTWSQGDFNGDGKVNIQDLSKLAANFGFDNTSSGGSAAVMPMQKSPAEAISLAAIANHSANQPLTSWEHIGSLLDEAEEVSLL